MNCSCEISCAVPEWLELLWRNDVLVIGAGVEHEEGI